MNLTTFHVCCFILPFLFRTSRVWFPNVSLSDDADSAAANSWFAGLEACQDGNQSSSLSEPFQCSGMLPWPLWSTCVMRRPFYVKVWWEDVQCTEPPWTYLNLPALELTSWSRCPFCFVVCGCLFVFGFAFVFGCFLFWLFVLFAFFFCRHRDSNRTLYWSCLSSSFEAHLLEDGWRLCIN